MGFYRLFYEAVGWEYNGTRERLQLSKQKAYKMLLNIEISERGDRAPSYMTLDEFIRQPTLKPRLNSVDLP
jgi:hypothetical protein